MVFSDSTGKTGIVEQTLSMMRVKSVQHPVYKIANSVNNYLDLITGYAILTDKKFQWDDTNHTTLPIGTTDLIANQQDYSFLTDEEGNEIITLIRLEIQDSNGKWHKLKSKDEAQIKDALENFKATPGTPQFYDKIADNIVRLYPTPSANVTGGLKFYFQRTGSYFTADDTVKSPGVPNLLHRGFVIAAALDGAITLGLENLAAIEAESQKETQKMITYFATRNRDEKSGMRAFGSRAGRDSCR